MEEQRSASRGRSVGIDIIKALAVLFVLCVHFSLNTNYYKTPIADGNMFFQSCLRWLFFLGVPLFLMCTGFLNYKKTISRGYYLKVFRVIIPYLLISILCLFLKKPTDPTPVPVGFQEAVLSVFSFKADSYSWYVNMYIGLFLIAPLFNIVVNTLDQKKSRILLGALIVAISLPATFNPLFDNIQSINYFFLPNWWQGFYPVLYYFIGAYIAKYKIEMNKSICALGLIFLIFFQTGLQIFLNRHQQNNWLMSDYSSLFVVAESICFFLLLYSANVKNRPFKIAVKWVSVLTLEIYLFSNITDSYIYPYFSDHFYGPAHPMSQELIFKNCFTTIILLTFLSSLILSIIFHAVYGLFEKGFKAMIHKSKPESVLQREAETSVI